MDCDYTASIMYIAKWILVPMAAATCLIAVFMFMIMMELFVWRSKWENKYLPKNEGE